MSDPDRVSRPDPAHGLLRGRLESSTSAPRTGETFEELVVIDGVTIEAIYSSETPESGEYCQDHDEWVMVIDGGAQLDVDGREVAMGPGDWILIRSGVTHRVLSTEHGTRWLAVHLPAVDDV